jgi:hypothetical protein
MSPRGPCAWSSKVDELDARDDKLGEVDWPISCAVVDIHRVSLPALDERPGILSGPEWIPTHRQDRSTAPERLRAAVAETNQRHAVVGEDPQSVQPTNELEATLAVLFRA